jgi:hypothetical protein
MIVTAIIIWGEGKRLEVHEDQQLSDKVLRCYRGSQKGFLGNRSHKAFFAPIEHRWKLKPRRDIR